MLSRIGSFCYRRRGWVIAAWILIVIAGGTSVGPLLQTVSSANFIRGLEADEGQRALVEGRVHGREFTTVVAGIDRAAPELARAVADVRGIPGVHAVGEPYAADTGSGAAVQVQLVKAGDQSLPLRQAQDRFGDLAEGHPGVSVRFGGIDLISDDTNALAQQDMANATMYSLPITLVVLVFVFGGLLAASIPVITAVATIASSFGLMLLATRVLQIDNTVLSVVDLLGLGLSIDYGLLLVARYREELAAGHDRPEAIRRAWATAGRTVLFSALTVAAALSSLLVIQQPRLQTMGAAGIASALLGMLAAVTLVPALLGVFGGRVRPSRARTRPVSGVFARIARITQRVPVLVLAGVLIVLAVASSTLTNLEIRMAGADSVPPGMQSLQVEREVSEHYGFTSNPPLRVVAEHGPAELEAWSAGLRGAPGVARVEPARAEGPGLSSVAVLVRGDSQGPVAKQVLDRLRADRPDGVRSWVTGETAGLHDLLDRTSRDLPLAIAVALLAMLVLLFLMTGSLIAPLVAVALNIVSLSATFGMLVLLFQQGRLSGPLDTLPVSGLSVYLLVTVFAFGFAFAMDYHVFLLARIKEYADRGHDTNTSVRYGLQHSGRLITLAAAVMGIVFACFGASKIGDLEQLGLALLVAVIVDATLVRCLLLPATMTLLGRWNWWAPWGMRRVHRRIGIREHEPEPLARV
ncbi:MMPL family transporter [Nonomuraea sp. SBT364]|uniref:MMPL family transporter n=1 Tax=Nonomuraea sp. SBT364 TaxID=1580530 RepID=UPI00066D2272|nr:MMPL family transporter [Nonomuraea sp. SBT364]